MRHYLLSSGDMVTTTNLTQLIISGATPIMAWLNANQLSVALVLIGVAVLAVWAAWFFGEGPDDYDVLARSISDHVVEDVVQDAADTTAFDRYWAKRLRAAMNYPHKFTIANRQVACSRLDSIWREEAPDLRICDKLRHRATVVAYAFVPGDDEVEAARVATSATARNLREEISCGEGF